MRLWRIARSVYDPLDGEGARRFGGRWTSAGAPVVYLAQHLSLAALEVLVHTDPDLVPRDLAAFEVEVPDGLARTELDPAALPPDWAELPMHPGCRALGDAWLADGSTPLLVVPSALVPEERNHLLSPAHPEAARARVVRSRPFVFDARLLRGRG